MDTSARSVAAAASSCSLVVRGHPCSCSENHPVKPCLDHLLGAIDALQQEVLHMRVSHNDKGSNAETQPPKPKQRIHVFIRDNAEQLFYGTTNPGAVQSWDEYRKIGSCTYGVSAVSLNPKHIALLSSHGGYIYYQTWDGKQWLDRGAIPSVASYTRPTIIQTSRNGFELFYVSNADNTIWHLTGTAEGGWSVGTCLGDQECRSGCWEAWPMAVSRDHNLVDLFFEGADHSLYWKSWADVQWKPTQHAYVKLGENCAYPGGVARHRERIDLFALNLSGELLHKSWNGRDWEPRDLGFRNLGGSFASRPVAVSRSPERLDLFIIGKDSRLYHKALAKSIWKPATGFLCLGGNFAPQYCPGVVWSRDGMEIFLAGGEGTGRGLFHKRWDGVGDPLLSEFEPLLKWDCRIPPEVLVLDALDPTK